MTGYTVHTGSSEDFASGWDRVFADNNKKKEKKPKKDAPKTKAKKNKKK